MKLSVFVVISAIAVNCYDCAGLLEWHPNISGGCEQKVIYQFQGSAYHCNWGNDYRPIDESWGGWSLLGSCDTTTPTSTELPTQPVPSTDPTIPVPSTDPTIPVPSTDPTIKPQPSTEDETENCESPSCEHEYVCGCLCTDEVLVETECQDCTCECDSACVGDCDGPTKPTDTTTAVPTVSVDPSPSTEPSEPSTDEPGPSGIKLLKYEDPSAGKIANEGSNWDTISELGGSSVSGTKISDSVITSTYSNTKGALIPILQPWNNSLPTYADTLITENKLLASHKLLQNFREALEVRPETIINAVTPGNTNNPTNVKLVEKILSAADFDYLFPIRHKAYSYENWLKAVAAYPVYCKVYTDGRDSEAICRKLLATSFAHFTQETGYNGWTTIASFAGTDWENPGAASQHNTSAELPREFQALYHLREMGYSESTYTQNYISLTAPWNLVYPHYANVSYFGRGSKQLSWNYNYADFSAAIFGDRHILLNQRPSDVATTWLNFASAVWFSVTPQVPKPSMISVIDGTFQPNSADLQLGLNGFGATIVIINGGLECGPSGRPDQAESRIKYYKHFSAYLKSPIPADEVLNCSKTSEFPANGNGTVEAYWDKKWGSDELCAIVAWPTPFKAFNQGDLWRCINFNHRSVHVQDGKIVARDFGMI